ACAGGPGPVPHVQGVRRAASPAPRVREANPLLFITLQGSWQELHILRFAQDFGSRLPLRSRLLNASSFTARSGSTATTDVRMLTIIEVSENGYCNDDSNECRNDSRTNGRATCSTLPRRNLGGSPESRPALRWADFLWSALHWHLLPAVVS